MELLRKYNTQTDIYFPLIKAGVQNFAVSADYTHSAGDVKVSKDGGAAATATNSPSAITMGNGAVWKLTLTATEMAAGLVVVTIIDASTKAIEDQAILISTYGHASAQLQFDLGTATQSVAVSSMGAGVVDAASIATDAITAGKIAADSIGSSELAATATAEIAQAVWDALMSALTTSGSVGKLLADNLNATVSSRATQASLDVVDDFLDTEIAAIKAKTDNLPAAPAAVGDIPTAAVIADAVLDEVLAEPTAVFSWPSSLRSIVPWLGAMLRNKMTQTGTTGTLRNDADSGTIATATISDDATTFTRGEWS